MKDTLSKLAFRLRSMLALAIIISFLNACSSGGDTPANNPPANNPPANNPPANNPPANNPPANNPPANTNAPPVAIAPASTTTLAENSTATITLSGSDADGDSLTYQIATQSSNGSVTINGNIVTYTPNANYNGSDSFAFTVTDGNGSSQPEIVNITVLAVNDVPIAMSPINTTTLAEDNNINIILSGVDVDGDSLTYQITTQPANGSITLNGNIATYTPNANYNGSDSFAFTVTDNATPQSATSQPAIVNITIAAVNDAPVAIAPANTTKTGEDSTATITLSSSDADGDSLTYQIATQSSNGSVTINGNIVTYTPNANYNGSDSFAFTVTDGNGSSQPETVNITILAVNDVPIAMPPINTTTLAEDTNINIILSGSDVDGDSLTYQITTQPANGSITLNGNIATYTPNANYNGSDSFAFTVTDDTNASSQPVVVNITISAVGDAPVAIVPVNTTLAEDSTVTITLSGSDIDSVVADLTYQIATQPANGTVTINANIATYTPNANYNGNDSFTFTAIDEANASSQPAIVNITISTVNDAPVASDLLFGFNQDSNTTTITLTATDVDGDNLIYSVTTPTIAGLSGNAPNLSYFQVGKAATSFSFVVSDGSLTATATAGIVNRTLVVTGSSETSISLSWGSGDYFKLYRFTSSTETTLIYEGENQQYTDSSLNATTSYSYQIVYCADADNCESLATKLDAVTVPNAPTISATALSRSEIRLSWDAVAGASIYRLYRSTQVAGVYTQLNPVSSTSAIDYGLDVTTTYYYQISACTLDNTADSTGSSCSDRNATSAQGTATTTTKPSINAEYNLVVNSNGSDNQINLSWTTTGTNFVRISASTATETGFSEIYSGTATSFIHTNLTSATSYYYRLQLCGGNNISSCTDLDTVISSQQTATVPSIPIFAQKNSSKDFDTISGAGNISPRGIWSDGTTMWVADNTDNKLYAYNLATKAYDSSKDFETLQDAGNTSPTGIWSDGTTMWVADLADDKIYAYSVATKARDSSKDFNTLVNASNLDPEALWSDGVTMWVADTSDNKLYAYNLATKARDSSKDFNTLSTAGNGYPTGIWSDGITMWVSDWTDDKVYAYNVETKAIDSSKDFNTVGDEPEGIWSDGTTIWVVESASVQIYAYNLNLFITAITAQSSTQIALSWNAIAGASIYRVYRSTQVDGVYTQLSPVASTSTTDGDLDAATTYYYQISACTLDNTADSTASTCSDRNAVIARASGTTILSSAATYSLVVKNNSSDNQNNLSWTTTDTNFVRISASTATDSGFSEIYSGTATNYIHTNLLSATSYYYRLQLCGNNNIGSCFGLNTVSSSQPAYTVANIYDFSNFGQRNSSNDFDTLTAANNNAPTGIISDGTIMWVADYDDNKIYAYDLATKARDSKEFESTDLAFNNPLGIWSDGTTMWVVRKTTGTNNSGIYAYTVATKARDSSKDFNTATLTAAGNNNPEGIWSDGTTMWVADSADGKIYAYSLATNARDSGKEFDTLFAASNRSPRGMWSDGATMWVVDSFNDKLYAYSVATKVRDSRKDFNSLTDATNDNPYGIWSDGSTMWITDLTDDKLYAYNLGFITAITAQSSTQIALSWNAIAGASIYRVYRSTQVDGVYTQLSPVASTSTTDGGLDAATTYYYQISACTLDNTADSTASTCSDRTDPAAQASAMTRLGSGDAEYNLVISNGSDNQINLSWTTTGTNLVRISVSTATDTGFTEIYSGDTTSFVHTNLAGATSYYYRLQLCAGTNIDSCFGLNTVSSSQPAYTVPNIYGFSNFDQRNSSNDFNSLTAANNNVPTGIISDGTTMWVADFEDNKIYAYNLATKARDSSKEFEGMDLDFDNPLGIWSDGTTMWVVRNSGANSAIYAYTIATKARDSSKDFNTATLTAAGNNNSEGIWSDGTTMWVADTADDKIYAYTLATNARDSSKDFDTLIAAGNRDPRGMWSDGATMWVADIGDDKLYAYSVATKVRVSSKDINALTGATNNDPYGIWSDGSTMWITDLTNDKLYAYNLGFISAITAQSSTQIALSWNAIAGASIYRVYRSTQVAGVYTQLSPVASTSTTDGDLDAATTYYYQISACTLDNTADSTASTCSDRTNATVQASATTMAGGAKILYNSLSSLLPSVAQQLQSYIANSVAIQIVADSESNNSNQAIVSEAQTITTANQQAQPLPQMSINKNSFSTSGQCLQQGDNYWLPPTVTGNVLDQNHLYRWGNAVYGDWDYTIATVNSNSLCGFNDWRVPTAEELQQLYADAGSFSTLQSLMANILAQPHWTSTSTSTSTSSNTAIAINLANGVPAPVAKSSYQKLILIRK